MLGEMSQWPTILSDPALVSLVYITFCCTNCNGAEPVAILAERG